MKTTASNEITSIKEHENILLDAMLNSNVPILEQLLHDDLLFTLPNGDTITKAIDIESYSSGNMQIQELSYTDQQINLIGDNAVISVVVTMKGKFFDHSIDGKYKIIRIWKLANSMWKVIAGSSTLIN